MVSPVAPAWALEGGLKSNFAGTGCTSGVAVEVVYLAVPQPMKSIHFVVVNYKHNPEFCKAFGSHLRYLREQKGLGMRQFALQADIEYSQLSKIERGVTNPTISTLSSLAESLGVSHQELFDFKFSQKNKK